MEKSVIRLALIGIFALSFTLSGCSTARKGVEPPGRATERASSPEARGEPELYGPHPTETPETYGPQPVESRPVVLVLSSGMAKGYAHAGVIRALTENHVAIGAVIAAEMGSLVAALYAMDTNLNRLEWSLMRFEKEVFSKRGLMSTVFDSTAIRLEGELRNVFGSRDLADARVPTGVAIRVKGMGVPVTVDRGPVAQVLRAALAAEGIISPAEWHDGMAVSAKGSWDILVREARALALGPIVFVNVTGLREPSGMDVDLVLTPDLRGLADHDFSKRTEFAFRGSKSVVDALPRIRKLTTAGQQSER